MLLAELAYQAGSLPQVVPGHRGKEMMLDLAVQAAAQKVRGRVFTHVACGHHLACQEIDVVRLVEHRHTLVIWREHRAKIDAEESVIDRHEHHRLFPGEEGGKQSEVPDVVEGDQQQLASECPGPLLQQIDVHVGAEAQHLETQERDQEVRLVFDDEAQDASLLRRLLWREGNRDDIHVRIEVEMVWVAVMRVMLILPGGKASAKEKTERELAQEIVVPRAFEDLAMGCLVTDKGELPEHGREDDRVQRDHPG